jgi:hypothetical protein
MMLVVLVVQHLMLIILNIDLIDLKIVMDKFYEKEEETIISHCFKDLYSINSITTNRKGEGRTKTNPLFFSWFEVYSKTFSSFSMLVKIYLRS